MRINLFIAFLFITIQCAGQVSFGSLSADLRHSIIIEGDKLSIYDNASTQKLRSYSISINDNHRGNPVAFLNDDKKKIIVTEYDIEVIDISTEKQTTYTVGFGDQNNFIGLNKAKICKVSKGTEQGVFKITVFDLERDVVDQSFTIQLPEVGAAGLSNGSVFAALSEKYIALFFMRQSVKRIVVIDRNDKSVKAQTTLQNLSVDTPGDFIFGPKDKYLAILHSSGIMHYDFINNRLTPLDLELVTDRLAFITPDQYFVKETSIGVASRIARDRKYKYYALPGAPKKTVTERVTQAAYAELSPDGNTLALKYKQTEYPDSVYVEVGIDNETVTLLSVANSMFALDGNRSVPVSSNNKPFVYDAMNTPPDTKVNFTMGGKRYEVKVGDLFANIQKVYSLTQGFLVHNYGENQTEFSTKGKYREVLESQYLDFVFKEGKVYALVYVPNEYQGDSFQVMDISVGESLYTIPYR
jgi:hypothetical protein